MSDWRTIETAPKDGTRVLVVVTRKGKRVVAEGRYRAPLFHDGVCGYWYIGGVHRSDDSEPTHWMPLPEPPKEKE